MTTEPAAANAALNAAVAVAEAIFAGLGAMALLVTPFAAALARSVVHANVADAPTIVQLADRVDTAEKWQTENGEAVRAIPRMADTLERLDRTLDGLTKMLMRAGLARETE